jgi:hypothetical protein
MGERVGVALTKRMAAREDWEVTVAVLTECTGERAMTVLTAMGVITKM